MIFLCGISSEPSLGLVIERLDEMGAPIAVFHQRDFSNTRLHVTMVNGAVSGSLRLGGSEFLIENFTAIYTRLMEWRLLPEVRNEPPGSPQRLHCERLHAAIAQWHEMAPGRVLNRSKEVDVGYSKPMQSQFIRRLGFAIPETLVTNDPDEVCAFCRRHERVIYKSMSCVRSVVDIIDECDSARLESVRACPVQFQQYIEGTNVRVHTVGKRFFATSISSSAVDYRYAYLSGEKEKLAETTISNDLATRCVSLARALGLEFAGIDLKITDDGRIYCLEINPSPAFSYYELHTGQKIAQAVAEYLVEGS